METHLYHITIEASNLFGVVGFFLSCCVAQWLHRREKKKKKKTKYVACAQNGIIGVYLVLSVGNWPNKICGSC